MSEPVPLLSNEQLLDIYNLTKTATAIHVTEKAIIQTANEAMLQIWGKDRNVIGKSLEDALPELKGQPFIDLFKKVWREGLTVSGTDTPADLEIDGVIQTFYFDFEYRAIKNDQEETLCILHTATDVTERFLNREALKHAREKEEALHREQVLNEELAAANEELSAINEELLQTEENLSQLNNELEERVNSRVRDLSESEARFRTMAEGTDVLIGVGDETSNAVYFNTAWTDLTGRSMEDLLEFGWVDLVHPEDRNSYVQLYLSAFDQQVPFTGEFRVLNKEGDYRWLLAKGPPRFRPDGSFAGYISSCIDITERKLEEIEKQKLTDELLAINEEMTASNEELFSANEDLVRIRKELEQKDLTLRMAIDAARLGSWFIHPVSKALNYNQMLAKLFGYEAEQPMTFEQAIGQVSEDFRDRVIEEIEQAILHGGDYDITYSQRRFNDGELIWLRSIGKVSRDEHDDPTIFSGFVMDITELKKDEQRKNDFIGMVSHELKTPLTSLSGYIQMLQRKAKKADDTFTESALDSANKQVKKMTSMINGFLNISRLESGKIVLNKSKFRLDELVSTTVEESRLLDSSHTISVVNHCPIDITADHDKISNVISNLLSNALKYSPNHKIVEVKCEIVNGMALVSVKDQGIGISTQNLEKLFERYYRVEGNHTISGFGIGLYLSAEIIERHTGKIWVESEPGKGSTFYFSLPL